MRRARGGGGTVLRPSPPAAVPDPARLGAALRAVPRAGTLLHGCRLAYPAAVSTRVGSATGRKRLVASGRGRILPRNLRTQRGDRSAGNRPSQAQPCALGARAAQT